MCRGGSCACLCVGWGGRMVIERFTNPMFDNRNIILYGGQSSSSKANIGKPYLVQFQIIISIQYDSFFVLTLKVPIFNLKLIKQITSFPNNGHELNQKKSFTTQLLTTQIAHGLIKEVTDSTHTKYTIF